VFKITYRPRAGQRQKEVVEADLYHDTEGWIEFQRIRGPRGAQTMEQVLRVRENIVERIDQVDN
jgi:hypothetical protein